jgi:hypothetical protein
MKNKILNFLYFGWGRVLPILLVLTFFVGVFFNLWKIMLLPLWTAILISVVACGLTTFGFGKLIKLW